MGKETKNFRQSNKSRSGDNSARNYARINREGGWSPYYGSSKKRRNVA